MTDNEEKKPFLIEKKKHYLYITRVKDNVKIRYDLKNKQLEKSLKNGKLWTYVGHQYIYFQGHGINSIEFKDKKFKELIKLTRRLNPRCESLSTFISRLSEAFVYEGYIIEGVEFQCWVRTVNHYYGGRKDVLYGVKKPLNIYTKPVIDFFKKNNVVVTEQIEETWIENKTAFENYVLKIDNIELSSEDKINLFNLISSNNTYISDLVTRFNYDIKSLVEYVYNYLKPFEGLCSNEAFNLLRDYYEMSSTIGRKVKKYPKYLKSMHDIIQANYKAFKTEYDEIKFLRLMNEDLEYSDNEFCIVNPKSSKDIISEGTDLNHCVASYVDKILGRRAYIMFLRDRKTPEQSLITLEYNELANKIIQAKGGYNRKINKDERTFLEKYCKIKKINLEVAP